MLGSRTNRTPAGQLWGVGRAVWGGSAVPGLGTWVNGWPVPDQGDDRKSWLLRGKSRAGGTRGSVVRFMSGVPGRELIHC